MRKSVFFAYFFHRWWQHQIKESFSVTSAKKLKKIGKPRTSWRISTGRRHYLLYYSGKRWWKIWIFIALNGTTTLFSGLVGSLCVFDGATSSVTKIVGCPLCTPTHFLRCKCGCLYLILCISSSTNYRNPKL